MMFSNAFSKEAPKNRSTAVKPAKIVKVMGRTPESVSGTVAQEPEENVIILGVSLSQPYSHGRYVRQIFDAIDEEIKEKTTETYLEKRIQSNWHVIVLLSTAFDPANNPSFNIADMNSPSSIEAKKIVDQEASSWISEHANLLDSYCFNYTIMSGDKSVEGEDYQQIFTTFLEAYENGNSQQKTKNTFQDKHEQSRSLSKVSPGIKLTDRIFYNSMMRVIESYVQRHYSQEMTESQRNDLKSRSEWVVLREYALIFMLSLRKIPLSFSNQINLVPVSQLCFFYPFGNFGKEVQNLLKVLCCDSLDVYNIKLSDFCSKKDKGNAKNFSNSHLIDRTQSPPLTEKNLSDLQNYLREQDALLSRLSDSQRESWLNGLSTLLNKYRNPQVTVDSVPADQKESALTFCEEKDHQHSATCSLSINSTSSLYQPALDPEKNSDDDKSNSVASYS